jgi:L-lactate dehydrogenase complex protein LldG
VTSRSKILDKISHSLAKNPFSVPDEPDWDEPDLQVVTGDFFATFTDELEKVSGEVVQFESFNEAVGYLNENYVLAAPEKVVCSIQAVTNALGVSSTSALYDGTVEVGITRCECLIARTGTVCVSSDIGRSIGVMPSTLIVMAKKSQIVPTPAGAIEMLKAKYKRLPSQISFLTGPSRTADIEKTLVMGAHGAEKLIVILLPENAFE